MKADAIYNTKQLQIYLRFKRDEAMKLHLINSVDITLDLFFAK